MSEIELTRLEPEAETIVEEYTPKYIRIACKLCKTVLTVDEENAGEKVLCSECKEYVDVPADRFGEGVVIGDFIIQDKIAEGSTGTVFKAYQRSLERQCAIKIFNEDYWSDENAFELFQAEAKTVARMNHSNIVQCYAVGDQAGVSYYAMELVDGSFLRDVLREKGKMSPKQAIDVVRQIAAALDYAWETEQLVHRDVRPGNIILTKELRAKLSDFGLVGHRDEVVEEGATSSIGNYYVSPEELRGEKLDGRSHMYTLGLVLVECLTGCFPFAADNADDMAKKHLEEEPELSMVLAADLPGELIEIIQCLLQKQPQKRFPDMSTMIRQLDMIYELCADGGLDIYANPHTTVFVPGSTVTGEEARKIRAERRMKPIRMMVGLFILGLCFAGCVYEYLAQRAEKIAAAKQAEAKTEEVATAPAPAAVVTTPAPALVATPAAAPAPVVKAEPAPAPVVKATPVAAPVVQQVVAPVVKQPAVVRPVVLAPTAEVASSPVRIASVLPDPKGFDEGKEEVFLENVNTSSSLNLKGWKLRDNQGCEYSLQGVLAPGGKARFILPAGTMRLNNTGAIIMLVDPDEEITCEVSYAAGHVIEGKSINFSH